MKEKNAKKFSPSFSFPPVLKDGKERREFSLDILGISSSISSFRTEAKN
jgi:hypothetical protein